MHRALVVDDSSMMRRILQRSLELAGFPPEAVRTAKDGREALEKIEAQCPDIVLCDVNMPNLDGFGVLEELGKRGMLERLPVVMVTSRTTLSTVRRLLQLGAREVIAKPFEPQRLHERVSSYLTREPTLAELGPGPEQALLTAGLATLEQLLFIAGSAIDTGPASCPHIVAEVDVTHPAGTLVMAGIPETLVAIHPDSVTGVAAAAEVLAELLNVLVGAFRAELGVDEGGFGLPRTRLAAADDFVLRGGAAIDVGQGAPLRLGFIAEGEAQEQAAPGTDWVVAEPPVTSDGDGWVVPEGAGGGVQGVVPEAEAGADEGAPAGASSEEGPWTG